LILKKKKKKKEKKKKKQKIKKKKKKKMDTRPHQIPDENLPPKKGHCNFMKCDSNYNTFINPNDEQFKIDINNPYENKNKFKSNETKSTQDAKGNVNNNIDNNDNVKEEYNKENDLLEYNEESSCKEISNSQNDRQIDIIGNISEEDDESENNNTESEEEIKKEETKEFDEGTKEKLRSEARKLGINNN